MSITTTPAGTSTGPDALADAEQRLVDRYARDGVDAELVLAQVAAARDRLAGARISAFLPILVERSVHRALAV